MSVVFSSFHSSPFLVAFVLLYYSWSTRMVTLPIVGLLLKVDWFCKIFFIVTSRRMNKLRETAAALLRSRPPKILISKLSLLSEVNFRKMVYFLFSSILGEKINFIHKISINFVYFILIKGERILGCRDGNEVPYSKDASPALHLEEADKRQKVSSQTRATILRMILVGVIWILICV